MIDGANIAKILFDPSAQTIGATDAGTKALGIKARPKAIEALRRTLERSAGNSPSKLAKADVGAPHQ
jgi:hypothetical protein